MSPAPRIPSTCSPEVSGKDRWYKDGEGRAQQLKVVEGVRMIVVSFLFHVVSILNMADDSSHSEKAHEAVAIPDRDWDETEEKALV